MCSVENRGCGVEGPGLSQLFAATTGYCPTRDGEIKLATGDIITDVRHLRNGWTLGRNVSRDIVGIFPSAYIAPESDLKDEWPPIPSHLNDANIIENSDILDAYPLPDGYIDEDCPVSSHCSNHDITDDEIIENPHTYERLGRSQNGIPPCMGNGELNNGFPEITTEDYNSNSLPISPKKPGRPSRKPHMFVRPNPSKSIFRSDGEMTVKCDAGHSPIRHAGSQTPPPRRPSTPVRRTSRSSIIDDREGASSPTPIRVAPAPPARAGTSCLPGDPLTSDPTLTRSTASSPLTPNTETSNQNVMNESMNGSPHTPHKIQYGSNGAPPRYYQDYRTLECPASQTDSPPHTIRYKPILKHKIGFGPAFTGHRGRGSVDEIYYNERGTDQRSLRLMVSALSAIICGLLLFLWLYYALGYDFLPAAIVAGAVALLLLLSWGASRLCRCIGTLLLPSLCTTRGRIGFLILVTGVLLDGPVTNIYLNMGEVSRAMACSAEQSYNQSMLLLQPFDTMMTQLNSTVGRLQIAARNVSDKLHPLNTGLSSVELGLYEGKLGLQGTEQTCKRLIDQAFLDCNTGIVQAQNSCLSMVNTLGDVYHIARGVLDQLNPELWAPKHVVLQKRQVFGIDSTLSGIQQDKRDVCEPLDTVLVCQALNDSDVLCQPSGWAGDAIYDAINATQSAMFRLNGTLRFTINPEPYYSVRVKASKMIYQVRRKVQQEFFSRTMHFHYIISIIKKLLPIALIILVYVSYDHIRNYVSKDTYDNVYVTPQFKSLDQKRSEVAGESLLPLKRYERNYLIDTMNSELSPPEDGLYHMGLAVMFLHLTISFISYFFDYVLYWILALTRRHGEPEYDFTGKDSLEFVIEGGGVISDLIRVFLKGFHPANLFGYTLDTHHCLPRPSPPSIFILLVLFLLYFTLILSILLKAYILRLRNRLTAYFYPAREKARIVHLYNVVLNHRYRMPKLLHQRARATFRERLLREQVSVVHQMASKCPPCRMFLYSQSRCLVCGGQEEASSRDCSTEHCRGAYCAECYEDIGRVCPICQQGADNSDDEDYHELADDLQPYSRSSKIYV